jgi:uncharacterized protein (DUF983 family)
MQSASDLPSTVMTGLRCRCPRCGDGRLFSGFLQVAERCDHCGLDYSFADPADGPAFFVMSGVGVVVVGAWAWTVVMFHPPLWVQFATVFPALIGGCLACLRPVKAWLVAEQYVHKAQEATWSSTGAHGEGGFAFDRRKASQL